MEPRTPPPVRIGELSRRTGVSPDLLRVWERRYGLLEPRRTEGGFRLYGERDVDRVMRMTMRLSEGLPASIAAQLALDDEGPAGAPGDAGPPPATLVAELRDALDTFDEERANAVIDRAVSDYSLTTVLGDVVMPYLQELGGRWEAGEVTIAQEHFATGIVRGRLLGLARGWGGGEGPTALLACPPGEQHDLGLVAFGLTLRSRGWRIVMLGANTPVATLAEAVHAIDPDLVVVATMDAALLDPMEGDLTRLAAATPLAVAGPGASPGLAERVGAQLLDAPPVAAALAVRAPARSR